MNILVINAGSSSLKFTLYRGDEPAARGHYLDIGEAAGKPECIRKTGILGAVSSTPMTIRDHREAIGDMLVILRDAGLVSGGRDIDAIGHRVVHGGEKYGSAAPVTPEMMEYLRGISGLAPLHNPVALACIDALTGLLAGTPQYAVFDTAFHRTMPEAVYRYALPT
ncbi:MAG TPA: acetate kinase, partial [Spirochaetota bacterium]|nr:acetate kinase [Spirochaetota bacterium]